MPANKCHFVQSWTDGYTNGPATSVRPPGSDIDAVRLRRRIAELERELEAACNNHDAHQLVDNTSALLVDCALHAVALVNAAGRVVRVNSHLARLFGYNCTELVGQPMEIMLPERFRNQHPAYRQTFFRQPSARPMGAGRDLWARRRDGSEFPVEIGLTPLQAEEGLIVLVAIVDISERVRSKEREHRRLAELAHAARLSTVGQMFAELAHEVNQPLGAAANYARACLREIESNDTLSRQQLGTWIHKVSQQSERAIEIVRRIGDFIKRDEPRRTSVSLNDIVKHVALLPILEFGTEGAIQPVRPELQLQPGLPEVIADKMQIEQVVVNLVRNAVDALSGTPQARRRLVIRTESDGRFVKATVSDNGRGMHAEQLSQVFTPFVTTKRQGMGLGLSISKSIIDAHLGSIHVDSQPGAGATFCIALPIAKAEC